MHILPRRTALTIRVIRDASMEPTSRFRRDPSSVGKVDVLLDDVMFLEPSQGVSDSPLRQSRFVHDLFLCQWSVVFEDLEDEFGTRWKVRNLGLGFFHITLRPPHHRMMQSHPVTYGLGQSGE